MPSQIYAVDALRHRERLRYLGKVCAFSCDIPTQPPLQQPGGAPGVGGPAVRLEVARLIWTYG